MSRRLSCVFRAAGAICVLAAMPAFAQDRALHNSRTDTTKGASVIIEGCVTAGQKPGTFVLGTVKEVKAVPVEMLRKRIYWLDSVKQIEGQVGHQVRIAGRVYDLERSRIEIDLGAGPDGGAIAKLGGPGSQEASVPTTTVGLGPVGTEGQSEADVLITLVKIRVDKVTRLSGTCP